MAYWIVIAERAVARGSSITSKPVALFRDDLGVTNALLRDCPRTKALSDRLPDFRRLRHFYKATRRHVVDVSIDGNAGRHERVGSDALHVRAHAPDLGFFPDGSRRTVGGRTRKRRAD